MGYFRVAGCVLPSQDRTPAGQILRLEHDEEERGSRELTEYPNTYAPPLTLFPLDSDSIF